MTLKLFLITLALVVDARPAQASSMPTHLRCLAVDRTIQVAGLPAYGTLRVSAGGKTKSYLTSFAVREIGAKNAEKEFPGYYQIEFLLSINLEGPESRQRFSVVASEPRPGHKSDYVPFSLESVTKIVTDEFEDRLVSRFEAILVTEDPRAGDGSLLPKKRVTCAYSRFR